MFKFFMLYISIKLKFLIYTILTLMDSFITFTCYDIKIRLNRASVIINYTEGS